MTPTICVGIVGHLRSGKSTLLKAILNNENDPRGADAPVPTEKLHFAHAKIYRGGSSDANNYRSFAELPGMEEHAALDPTMHLSRRVSFVDCPGNNFFVPTMLKGIMMTDGVLVLSQPKEGFSRAGPTLELLSAAHRMGRSIVLVQTIKDKVDKQRAKEHRVEIRESLYRLKIPSETIPILQVSELDLKTIGKVCEKIEMMPILQQDGPPLPALMLIGSSRGVVVDPQEEEEDSVLVDIHGRIAQGLVRALGDGEVAEVRPGIVLKQQEVAGGAEGRQTSVFQCHPIFLKVVSVVQPQGAAEAGADDGLVTLRASVKIPQQVQGFLRSTLLGEREGLEGHVLGHPADSLPGVYDALKMFDPYHNEIVEPVPSVERGEVLLLIIGTIATSGTVQKVAGRKGRIITMAALSPFPCAREHENILICRKLTLGWHLIGGGTIISGRPLPVVHLE